MAPYTWRAAQLEQAVLEWPDHTNKCVLMGVYYFISCLIFK